jgi:hypothetical protein
MQLHILLLILILFPLQWHVRYFKCFICAVLFTKLGSEKIFSFHMCKVIWTHWCKCILISYVNVNLHQCLLPQTSCVEFLVQAVQVKEGRMASGFLPTDVTLHSSTRVNTNANWGMVDTPSSWASTLDGHSSSIQWHNVTATLTFPFICDVDKPVSLCNLCTLAAVAVTRTNSSLILWMLSSASVASKLIICY